MKEVLAGVKVARDAILDGDAYFCDIIYLKKLYSSLIDEGQSDSSTPKKICDYALKYVSDNYSDKNPSIERESEGLNYTNTYVSSIFKKNMGISFTRYLADYRVDQAKQLLCSENAKMKDIAKDVGFGTYGNFARVFKKATGMSPADYREKNLNQDKDK